MSSVNAASGTSKRVPESTRATSTGSFSSMPLAVSPSLASLASLAAATSACTWSLACSS